MARPRLSSFSSSSFALRRSSASFAAGSTARPASSSISSRSSMPGAPAFQGGLEQLRDLAIVGARVEQPAIKLLRLGPLSQPVVEDLRRAAHDVDHRRLLAQLALQVVRQQARQVLPAIQLVGQPNELFQAEALGRRFLEHLAVPAQGAVVVLQLLLVEARDPLGPRQALRGLLDLQQANLADLDQRGPVGAARVHRLQQLGGLPPHRGVVEHPFQHRDRARVIGIAGQHQAQVFERGLAIVLPIVLDLRHAELDADQIALRQDAPLQQVLQQPRQIAPALGLGVQTIERLRRVAVADRDLQHALVRRDRLLQAAQGILGQRADLQPQLAFGLGVGPRQLRAPDQDLVQRLAVAGPAIDALERLQRILVVGNAVEDAAVVVRRRRRVALGQRDLGDGAIQAQLHRLVEHVRADLAVQRRDLADPLQAGQPLVAVEQRRQLRLRQRVADRERRGRARRLLVAQTRLLERREPHQLFQAAARVGLRLDIDAHHRRQLGVAPVDLVDRLQRLRRRQPQGAVGPGRQETFQRGQRVPVGGRRLQHLAPAPERVGRIAERPFQQRRDLPQQRRPVQRERPLVSPSRRSMISRRWRWRPCCS